MINKGIHFRSKHLSVKHPANFLYVENNNVLIEEEGETFYWLHQWKIQPWGRIGNKKRLNANKSCHEILGREGKGSSATRIVMLNNCCFQVLWDLSCAFREEAILYTLLKMLTKKKK